VIPVWGSYVARLEDCVADVLAQNAEVELLVVDNASDRPLPPLPAAVRTLRLDERVTVGAARNAALPHVRTRAVVFADVDDRLLPGALAHLDAVLRADAEAVAVVARQVHWNPRTGERRSLGRAPRPVVARVARFPRLLALCTLRFNVFPLVGCAALRTDAARAAGGFGDGNLGEDWELAAALAWRGRIVFSGRATRLYAVEDGSLWHRAHERTVFESRYAAFRARLYADPALPRWARATRALITRLQRRDLVRMFAKGAYRPPGLPGVGGASVAPR
jgi:glycosyltransferase involved in cell wall biosynthesis